MGFKSLGRLGLGKILRESNGKKFSRTAKFQALGQMETLGFISKKIEVIRILSVPKSSNGTEIAVTVVTETKISRTVP